MALVMGSCQQSEGTRGGAAPGKVVGTMLPRRIPQELGMDQPLRPDPAARNKQKRGAKTGARI